MISLITLCVASILATVAITTLVLLATWYHRSHGPLRKRLPLHLRFLPAHTLLGHRRIAFLADALTPSIERLYKGFESYLLADDTPLYTIKLFEGEGRTATTRGHLHTILSQDYDCIVTTSVFTTQIAQEVTTDTNTPLPIIFGNIPDREYHIVQHPTAFRHTTGVLTERDIETEISHVLALRPEIHHILLLSPSVSRRWLEYQQEHTVEAFEMQGITVEKSSTDEKALALINPAAYDMIIFPAHTLSPTAISTLSERCRTADCTLYTTDIDAVAHGAAIGTGGGEVIIGGLLAEKVVTILMHYTRPEHVPITTHVPAAQVRLHKKYLTPQSLPISESHLFIAKHAQVYREQ